MSDLDPSKQKVQRTDQTSVQFDAYGLKGRIQPARADEPAPRSWKELWRAVVQKLRSIVFNVFGVADDTVRSTRSIVRGIGDLGEIPAATARRIERAHEVTDAREDQAQSSIEAGEPALLAHEAQERLETRLRELQEKGVPVEMREVAPGLFLLVVVEPGMNSCANELAATELKALGVRDTDHIRSLPISELGLPKRVANALLEADLRRIGDVISRSPPDLLCIRDIGEESLAEIQKRLAEMGLRLRGV